VQKLGDSYTKLQRQWEATVMEYRRIYTDVIVSMRQSLDNMESYPIREQYIELVRSTMAHMALRVYATVAELERFTKDVEMTLREYKQRTETFVNTIADNVYNATYMKYAKNKLSQIKNIDISPYIKQFELSEEYSNAIDSVKDTTMTGIQYIWERPELDMLRGNLNSIYQQGTWAYNYWDVEKNLKTNIKNIMLLLVDIIEDELKQITQETQGKFKNPITVWLPEQGEMQMELPLPMDVERLDEVPDMSPIVIRVEKVANDISFYLPDQSTWESIKHNVNKMLPAREKEEEIIEDLKNYTPSKEFRKRGGKKYRRVRKMKVIRVTM